MRILRILKSLLSIFFLIAVSAPSRADYSNPVGIWDIEGKTALRASFSGLSLPARSVQRVDLVQFRGDGSYSAAALGTVDGRWRARKNKHYRITYDPGRINAAMPRDLSSRITDQFYALMAQTFGEYVAAGASIQGLRIKSYADTVILRNRGLKLKGLARVRGQIDFTVPDFIKKKMSKTVTARIAFSFRYQGERASAPSDCCNSDDAAQNLADSQAFLDENARLPKVQQTPSGLQYRMIRQGTGSTPAAIDFVTVNYRAFLPSGQEIDSREGISFPLDRVIPGWMEGLQLMREGGHFRFYIPPELAYGERGAGRLIKPNTALTFDVELIRIESSGQDRQ